MQALERRFESISVKGGVVAALTMLMMWPLSRVESLITERQSLRQDAYAVVCFFAWEHLARGMRLHPMQYLLVGLSLAMFYLLLLALSEHLGFGVSYAVAAGALVVLITAYISGATKSRVAAMGIGASLATSYGLLYLILLSQDCALLLGSLLLFAILAALMLATRRLDWAKIGGKDAGQ